MTRTTARKATKTVDLHEDDLVQADESMDADNTQTASADQLAKIVAAAAQLKDHTRRAVEFEQQAAEEKEKARQIANDILPTLMDEAHVPELTLDDSDERLVREDEVFASIAQVNMQKAIKWLDANNYGAIVKSQLVIPLDRSDPKWNAKVVSLLERAKIVFARSGSIHAATLKAFARESVEQQRKLPDVISVHVQPVVKIRAPIKAKKRRLT